MIAEEMQVQKTAGWGPAALEEVRRARREHQQETAPEREKWIRANRYFYDRMKRMLRFIVEPQKRVLDLRCETETSLPRWNRRAAWAWRSATRWWKWRGGSIQNWNL
jgi:hypothetical protein